MKHYIKKFIPILLALFMLCAQTLPVYAHCDSGFDTAFVFTLAGDLHAFPGTNFSDSAYAVSSVSLIDSGDYQVTSFNASVYIYNNISGASDTQQSSWVRSQNAPNLSISTPSASLTIAHGASSYHSASAAHLDSYGLAIEYDYAIVNNTSSANFD
ncbi:MAG: hypothetical protein J6I45_12000 [Clostridia bacterium]|nr:hypothetical protein [Clostridia bacterium]